MRYIPQGAIKVADKASDAVAYLYQTTSGKPAAMVYFGKQAQPVARYSFKDEAQRAKLVADYFGRRQGWAAAKAKRAADKKAQGRGVEAGQYLVSSWGYEQTNVDFYKVLELVGQTMAIVAKVGSIDVGAGTGNSMASKVIPAEDPTPEAERIRVTVKAGVAKIRGRSASTWDGQPEYVSWYA